MSNPSSYNYDYDLGYKPRDDRRDRRIEMLEERIQEIKKEALDEEELREKSPALQDAWEQYQIILNTIRPR